MTRSSFPRRPYASGRIEAARACPFDTMQVWDARAAGHVRYTSGEVGGTELGFVAGAYTRPLFSST